MTAVKQAAARVEAIAREASDIVWNDELRLEIDTAADLLHTISREGVSSALEIDLIADVFDIMTQGRTHRIKDRNAKMAVLDGMREIARLAGAN